MWVRAVVRMTPPPKQERQDTMKPPREFSDKSTWVKVGLWKCSRCFKITFFTNSIGMKPTMRDTDAKTDIDTIFDHSKFIFGPS